MAGKEKGHGEDKSREMGNKNIQKCSYQAYIISDCFLKVAVLVSSNTAYKYYWNEGDK